MPDLPAYPAAPAALPDPYFESPDRRFRLYQGDCLDLLPRLPPDAFDLIFADPPYFLSNDGITCHAGRMVSVNKGDWDKSAGPEADHDFCLRWLAECRRLLKPHGTVWVSGTMHIIHSVGYALQRLGFKLLNDITWVKPNPPPNLSCRYFTHATETLLWAARDRKSRHKFNYALMKRLNRGKQMKSVWTATEPGQVWDDQPPDLWDVEAPRREEKVFGKHPTQKPLALLERILAAATDENDLVLDPFSGSGTTGLAAARMKRAYTGLDADPAYLRVSVARFIGVPQADSPDRLLQLVQAHARGHAPPEDLARHLDVTPRQVHYYRQAAALLGLVAQEDGARRLTPAGAAVAEAAPPQARRLLAEAIRAHPLAAMAARRLRASRGEAAQAIADLLARCTVLEEATRLRRARTLIAWVRWAEENADGAEALLWRDVPAPAEEPDGPPLP